MRASLVAVLAVAPVAATVFILQSDLQRQKADAAREEALRQTREASTRLGRFVEGVRDALAVMAESPTIRNGDAAGCTAMLRQLKGRFGDQILLSANAADGWAVCNSAGATPRSVRNGERSSHQLPLQAGGFAVGGWEAGSGPRSSGLHMGLPIQAEGGIGFAGTMTAAVQVARLAEVLRTVPLPLGAELILVDRNDKVVLRLADGNASDLNPGDAVPPALMNLLPALPATGVDVDAETGRLVPATDERGASRLVALAPYVPGTEGALRLAVSYDPASLPVVASAAGGPASSMGMALGVGGLALALIVAFVGARVLLSRPLAQALASAASGNAGAGQGRSTGAAQPASAASRDNEALLALALETGNLAAWELDPATGALNHSENFDGVFGYGRPVGRWTWRGFLRHILPEDRPAAEEAFRRLRAEPGSVAHEVRIYREGDGELRVLHLRATHHRAPDGSARIFGVMADATDAMAAAPAHMAPAMPVAAPVQHAAPAGEQFRLSPAELSHRVRGMLATVQGIAAETLRAPPGTGGLIPAAAKTAFEARLTALGRSHEVLMREDGAKADLSELVNLVLAPHAAGPAGARHTASGPALWLPAATAVPISVALHELATNAARHGALSQPKGSVAVTWRLEEVGPGHAPMLRLHWEERGGPQIEGPPRRKGFGLKLLETGLAPEIGGLVSVEFRPTGLVCEIEAPLKAAAPAVSEAV